MECANCGKSTAYKPSLDDSGKHYIIEASDHGEEEKWAKYCSKCEKPYCGQCCFPQWEALKAKEGSSGPDLAKKLGRDPDAYFGEMPICPICGDLCSLIEPTKAGLFIATREKINAEFGERYESNQEQIDVNWAKITRRWLLASLKFVLAVLLVGFKFVGAVLSDVFWLAVLLVGLWMAYKTLMILLN